MLPESKYLNSKILIVDDLEDNVALLRSLLEQVGFSHIYSTTDSRDALKLYEEKNPDLILLDLNMPYLDGFQVMEQIKGIKQESYASIMVLTAQTDQNTRIKALRAGAQDFLSKPFDLIEVSLRIKKILEIKILNNLVLQQNQNLEKAVQERTRELQETRMETIYRLGQAAEFRDNDTGMHVVRMSRFSARLGKESNLSKEDCELILHASPMHDIGKIGIPDRVLLKPGKLDHDEWKIMKTHCAIGAKILSRGNNELTKMAKTIALCHHEKWDGSGYPNGLKSKGIPLIARIVSIADCFDALTSKRPYKEAWTVEDAMDEMNRITGSSFDPDLMKNFKRILPEILEIKEGLPDTERRIMETEAQELLLD